MVEGILFTSLPEREVHRRIHTGDKVEIDEDGSLKFTGRVKETFKTSKGKYTRVQQHNVEDISTIVSRVVNAA